MVAVDGCVNLKNRTFGDEPAPPAYYFQNEGANRGGVGLPGIVIAQAGSKLVRNAHVEANLLK